MKHKPKRALTPFSLFLFNIMKTIFPISKNTILFESNAGRNYTGNPKYIYEKMVKKQLDEKYRCIWIVEDMNTVIPGNCKKVRRLSVTYLYYMAIASFWVFDGRQPEQIEKRTETTYIQTWHGTPLKRLAMDMEVINMGGELNLQKYQREFLHSTKQWDYLISPNNYSTNIFTSAFKFHKEMLEIGYPRNDILVNAKEADIKKLKKKLRLPEDKKIILYAPTWRDDEYHNEKEFRFNLNMDLDAMAQSLKEEYILILKVHYYVKEQFDASIYDGFVHYFTAEQDIQQLYLVSDILITDYSSVMFDYSLLKRPIIFYTYDYEKYAEEIRGFYFNLEDEAPGPIVRTTEKLIEAIQTAEENVEGKYKKLYENFRKKYNHLDDGRASERVIDLIELIAQKS